MTNNNLTRLEQLELTNFRAFAHTSLELKPITILTGANSSGKSSILSAIAAIQQTRGANLFPFEFIPNGINCSLGGFKDIVHGGSTRSKFSIKLTLARKETKAILEGTYRYSPVGNHILPAELKASIGNNELHLRWNKDTQHYEVKYSSQFLSDPESVAMMLEALRAAERIVSIGEKEKNKNNESIPKNNSSRIEEFEKEARETQRTLGKWQKLKATNLSEVRSELSSNLGAKDALNDLQAVARDLWNQFTYIGPVRAYPERYYGLTERGNQIDPRGELSMLELMKWGRSHPKLFQEVTALLKNLQLADSLDPDSQAEEIIKVLVRPKGHKRFINYADTGFGISQVLPILVKDVALEKAGTLLINQPEVHLHPSAQAQLANHFSSRLDKRRYIIETHSEYLINRLRLLVAEKKLSPDQVGIYYFDTNTQGKAVTHLISILDNGNLSGAPTSYFSTYSVDAMKIVSAGF